LVLDVDVVICCADRPGASWHDLLATTHKAIVDAWDFSPNPDLESSQNHPLKGELVTVTHAGHTRDRCQHELPGGVRIWFLIDGQTIHLIDVHTHHPNRTKSRPTAFQLGQSGRSP